MYILYYVYNSIVSFWEIFILWFLLPMNTVTIWWLIGVVVFTGMILSVSAQEPWSWDSNSTSSLSEVNLIQSPYEQCLAYAKMKKLENFDCKVKIESMRNTLGTGTMSPVEPKPEPKREPKRLPPPSQMEINPLMGSGTKMEKDLKRLPPVGSGAMMETEIKNLFVAMGKLTPVQRAELMKIIRNYLESKGTKNTNPDVKKEISERKGWDGSVKWKLPQKEIQTNQQALQEKIKALKEKQKQYTGHVTLMK